MNCDFFSVGSRSRDFALKIRSKAYCVPCLLSNQMNDDCLYEYESLEFSFEVEQSLQFIAPIIEWPVKGDGHR